MSETGTNQEHRSDIHKNFENMREIFYEEPSLGHFNEILSLIVAANGKSDQQTLFDYAVGHLDSWPDEFRECNKNTKPSWKDIFFKGGKDTFFRPLFKVLNLEAAKLGLKLVQELAMLESSDYLTGLKLGYNNLGEAGILDLAELKNLSSITTLNLKYNDLGAEGLADFLGSMELENLVNLDLKNNYLDTEGVRILAESEKAKHLTTLHLGWNNIGTEGIIAIATSKNLENLTSLNLMGNEISLLGAKALARSSTLSMEVKRDLVKQNVISQKMAREEGIIS